MLYVEQKVEVRDNFDIIFVIIKPSMKSGSDWIKRKKWD